MPHAPIVKIGITRLNQFKREMAQLELYHALLLAAIFIFAIFITYHQTKSPTRSIYSMVSYAIILYLIHHTRNDKQFLKHIAQIPLLINIFEY